MKKKITQNDKIFVAGARGMVGKALCEKLYVKGYGEQGGGEIFTPTRVELDLLNYDAVQKWFEINKPSVVIIAAAKVGGIWANDNYPTEFLLENLKIQNNLIEISWKSGVRRLLFLGSSCIYPKFADQPIQEDSLLNGELEETNQWYAISKITGIKLCEALRKQYNFDAISLMPTNLYGPGDNYHIKNSHVLASFIRKFTEAKQKSLPSVICWGDGSPLREFLHVEDLAEAIIFCLENWDPNSFDSPLDKKGNPLFMLNIGSGVEISIKDLAKKIAFFAKYHGEILWDKSKPNGTPRKKLNIDKIKKLGWEPKIDLDEGILSTLEIYKNIFK